MISEVYVYGPVHGPTGYDEVTRSLLLGFYFNGARVRLEPFVNWSNAKIDTGINPLLEAWQSMPVGPKVNINVCLPEQTKVQPSMVNVNYTMFEADRICERWVKAAERMDLIIVPTEFNREVWVQSGVTPWKVAVVPIGIDTARYQPQQAVLPLFSEEGEAPLHERFSIRVVNMQEVITRKNLEGLLNVWVNTTTKDDDACLILKLGSFSGDAFRDFYKRFIDSLPKDKRESAAPVFAYTRVLPEIALAPFLANATHYFTMSYGEGWGLLETKSGAMARKVIAPRSTGFLGYLNDDNSYMIETEPVPAIMDSLAHIKSLYTGAHWFRPDVDSAKEQLRKAIDDSKAKENTKEERLSREIHKNNTLFTFSEGVSDAVDRCITPPLVRPQPSNVDRKMNLAMICKTADKPLCGIGDYTRHLYDGFGEDPMRMLLVGDDTGYLVPIDDNSVDVVHLQLEYQFIHYPRLRQFLVQLQRRGIVSVVTMHTVNKEAKGYHEVLAECADCIIVHSERAKQEAIAVGIPERKVKVIGMGVVTPTFENLYTDGKKRFMLAFFGFTYFHKGIDVLMRAFAKLRERDPNRFLLRLYATKPTQDQIGYAEQCRLLSQMLRFDDSCFKWVDTYLKEEVLCRYLSAANLIVLPYGEYGGIGTSAAVRTCLRAGTPLMLSDSCFFSDIPKNIYKNAARDANELAQQIWRYAQEVHSEKYVNKYMERRDAFVEDHSWDVVAGRHLALYNELLVEQKNKNAFSTGNKTV